MNYRRSTIIVTILMTIIGISSCVDNRSRSMEAKPIRALILVWNTQEKTDIWSSYDQELKGFVNDLYTQEEITYVLPYTHKQLKHPEHNTAWTASVIIGLRDSDYMVTAQKIVSQVKRSSIATRLGAADIIKQQPGLDMYYSIIDGVKDEAKLEQIVEYVFSDPKARKEYYGAQYIFSGPAMKELHQNNKAGRFLGYEVEERLYGADFPAWDLIHVVGFTMEQKERASPLFMEVWDRHAEKAFGKGMTFLKKKREWDKIRINIKSEATQQMQISLPIKEQVP